LKGGDMNGCDVCGKEDLLGYQLKVVCADCAAKIKVAVNSASTNTASLKLPDWKDIVEPFTKGLPFIDIRNKPTFYAGAKYLHEFLVRQLQA
jgi:hypothetical protein